MDKHRPKVGPLTSYKPPREPRIRPWDLSRSIDRVKIYILVDLELHSAYLMPIHAKTRYKYNIFGSGVPRSYLILSYLAWMGAAPASGAAPAAV